METNVKMYITAKPRVNGSIVIVCYKQRKGYSRYSRASVVFGKMHCNVEGCRFQSQRGEGIFSIYLILSSALGPGVYSAYNTNEYQKQKIFLRSRRRPVLKADNFTVMYEQTV
jgi:hypothetical protein